MFSDFLLSCDSTNHNARSVPERTQGFVARRSLIPSHSGGENVFTAF
jgi:hypothetical protein